MIVTAFDKTAATRNQHLSGNSELTLFLDKQSVQSDAPEFSDFSIIARNRLQAV
jgi:hypothetical protein